MTIKKRASTFLEFKEWVESLTSDGGEMLYRGLPLIKHDLNSSIARRIIKTKEEKKEKSKKPSDLDIWKVTSALIDDAKMQGYDLNPTRRGETPTTDFEILALLQHHYAATPLMDFSHNPFIALWFACQEHPDKFGKVIAVDPNKFQKNLKNLNEINNKINIKTDSITREGIKRIDKKGEEILLSAQNILWRFNPPGFDARILAQNSEFILGKRELTINDVFSICTITKNVKKNIQQKLDSYGISEERLFRDSSGFSRLNSLKNSIKNLDQILTDKKPTEQQEIKPPDGRNAKIQKK